MPSPREEICNRRPEIRFKRQGATAHTTQEGRQIWVVSGQPTPQQATLLEETTTTAGKTSNHGHHAKMVVREKESRRQPHLGSYQGNTYYSRDGRRHMQSKRQTTRENPSNRHHERTRHFLYSNVNIITIQYLKSDNYYLMGHANLVTERNFTRLCETKSMLVVNDAFPGPEIRVRKGDLVYVNVQNQANYSLTLHWHGILQPRNPWSDGPEYVTQCAIQPGTNFTYELVLSKEEGTVWWHAHSDWTRASVHGVIVILPAVGTTFPFPEPDEDEVIVIASWYKGNLQSRVDMAMAEKNTLPDSDAFTINGQPGDLIPCSADSTYRRKVDYGKTYLLRILNANMDEDLFFGIAEHNLTMVGMDGCYTKPLDTAYIMISAGQTMDVLLTANQSLGHYYMAARHFATENMDEIVWFDHYNVTAILEYNGNYTYPTYPSLPSTLPMYYDMQSYKDFIFQIRSLATPEHPISVPQDSDITTRMFITTSMNSLYCSADSDSSCQNIQITSSVNNISWFNPSSIDILQAYYRNISGTYTTDFPDFPPTFYNFTEKSMDVDTMLTVQGRKVKVLEYNESVEIVFQGTDVLAGSINHPMHLHGYTFYVVGQGFGNFDNVTDPKNFNLVDPPEAVTFGVPKKGWMAIRFTANNPGVWFWHCHIERHMTWGMESAFIVKNGPTTETSIRPPPAYMPLCSSDSGIQNFHESIEKKMEYT